MSVNMDMVSIHWECRMARRRLQRLMSQREDADLVQLSQHVQWGCILDRFIRETEPLAKNAGGYDDEDIIIV